MTMKTSDVERRLNEHTEGRPVPNWKPAVKFYDKDSINYNVICTSK